MHTVFLLQAEIQRLPHTCMTELEVELATASRRNTLFERMTERQNLAIQMWIPDKYFLKNVPSCAYHCQN